jgi:hypothetical protein
MYIAGLFLTASNPSKYLYTVGAVMLDLGFVACLLFFAHKIYVTLVF